MAERIIKVIDTGKKTKKGTTIWQVITDNPTRNIYDSFEKSMPTMEGKEVEEGKDFTVGTSVYQGKTQYIMNLAGSGGNNSGGGKRYGKSPEEIQTSQQSMSMSFAKDVIVALINSGVIKDAGSAFDTMRREYHDIMDAYKGGDKE